MILGVVWLESLGDIQANWKKMYLKFQFSDKEVYLLGDTSLNRTPMSLQAIRKTIDVDYAAILWPLSTLPLTDAKKKKKLLSGKQQVELQKLLGKNTKIFEEI